MEGACHTAVTICNPRRLQSRPSPPGRGMGPDSYPTTPRPFLHARGSAVSTPRSRISRLPGTMDPNLAYKSGSSLVPFSAPPSDSDLCDLLLISNAPITMAQAMAATASDLVTLKRPFQNDGFGDENGGVDEKPRVRRREADPAAALAAARHEFGEHGGVNMSIEASATFTVMEPDTMRRLFVGELGPDRGDMYIYSRHFNPTVLALGRQMAALEGTEAAYCTASGMSAISSVLMQLVGAGGHVVASRCLYGGTHALLSRFLPRTSGVRATFVDADDEAAVRAAVIPGETRVVYVETVSNPTLAVADIPMLARVAQDAGAKLVVDNTFTPVVVSPARLGADVVVHSVSKFISGGADIIAGAICGPASLVNAMMDLQEGALMLLGPTMNAKVAFELSERLPHLPLRMQEHSRRALAFATRMQGLGLRVVYPGLPDHPHHARLAAMGNLGYGFGGMLCVDMGTEDRANRLMHLLQNTTQFGLMAVSLGYYETLMSCSGSSTSSEMPPEDRARAGISPGLVRMSVGYNGTLEQRWAQFERALSLMQPQPALHHLKATDRDADAASNNHRKH